MYLYEGYFMLLSQLSTSLSTTLGITNKAGLSIYLPLDRYIPLLIDLGQHFEHALHDCYHISGISFHIRGKSEGIPQHISVCLKRIYFFLSIFYLGLYLSNPLSNPYSDLYLSLQVYKTFSARFFQISLSRTMS